MDLPQPPLEHKVNMMLPLPADRRFLWRRLDKSVRNQVRKAERSGLTIEAGGVENLRAFYEVFVARMRDLGSPVHAPGFLEACWTRSAAARSIVLVRKDGTTVGGMVALAFKDRLVVPWAACLSSTSRSARTCCSTGKRCAGLRRRVRPFDFGRSTRDSGTYRFKLQWGAAGRAARSGTRFHFASGQARTTGGASRRAELAIKAWQRLPLPLSAASGPHIRRYLTQ